MGGGTSFNKNNNIFKNPLFISVMALPTFPD